MKRILTVIFAILIILICMGIASKRFGPRVRLNSGYNAQETPTPTLTPTPSPSPSPSATPTPVPEPEPVPSPTPTPFNYARSRHQ
ncbi:MAG TPA: hypothetical protein VFU37_04690 [Pyrinomonadaceae bacterium]|nr:hypothetical protein [Pyrinomonadaceae bacterium]